MDRNRRRTDSWLLVGILAIAGALRFYHFGQLPFMHDEFSALFRLQYDSLSDLFTFGIIPDAHPAGVQLFLFYWVKWVGFSEIWVKLPFTLLGVGAVAVMYFLGSRWFNPTAGLFAALFLAVSQFTIFYSQLARPYSPGLFFVLLSTLYWTKIVFDEKPRPSDYVCFILAASFSAYMHAFSLFFILLQGLTGLWFVRGRRLSNYLISGFIILILFGPYLPIFLIQLQRGDVGGWLGKPDLQFFTEFVKYIFHFSNSYILVVLLLIMGFSIRRLNRSRQALTFRLIALCWFLATSLTAYLYSVYRTPVLQFSTLLFVFPFLLLFLLSFFNDMRLSWKLSGLLALSAIGVYTLVIERQHYRLMYQQGYDQIAENFSKDSKRLQGRNICRIIQAPDLRMFDHYLERMEPPPSYMILNDTTTIQNLNQYLVTHEADILMVGSSDYPPLSDLEYFRDQFPFQLDHQAFFNADYSLLGKEAFDSTSVSNALLRKILVRMDAASEGRDVLYTSHGKGFSPSIKIPWDSLKLSANEVLHLSASFSGDSISSKSILVFSIDDAQGHNLFWRGASLAKYFSKHDGSHHTAYLSIRQKVLSHIPPRCEVKAYIWKQDNSPLRLISLQLYKTRLDPVYMGLYEQIVAGD